MKILSSFRTILLLIIGHFFLISCNNDDEEVNKNNPPEDFKLINIADNSSQVDLLPVFNWENAVDTDEDAVRYDFYFGIEAKDLKLIEENLTNTTFRIEEALSLRKNYFWQVIAKDNREGVTASVINDFSTRGLDFLVKPITDEAPFSGRFETASTVYNDKIWIIGGRDDSNNFRRNDVWSSEDGWNWVELVSDVPFSERSAHQTVAFNGKIWVIGGRSNTSRLNDIWSSSNGLEWEQAISEIKFSPRNFFSMIVFNEKLWVIGGLAQDGDRTEFKNDIWYSEDGITWVEVLKQADFSSRIRHETFVYKNKLWIIGGLDENLEILNDVWYSDDGVVWDKVDNEPDFGSRKAYSCQVYDDKIWVIGGENELFQKLNDVWYSEDGITWKEDTNEAPFEKRSSHTSVVFKEKIWVIGGYGEITPKPKNDVWSFD